MYRYILSKLIPSSISFNFDMLSVQFLEFTLIISGRVKENNKNAYDYDSIRIDLLNLIQAGLSHSSAANYLSKKLKKPKNKIYGLIHKK